MMRQKSERVQGLIFRLLSPGLDEEFFIQKVCPKASDTSLE